MRKIILFVLAIAMLISLFACSSGKKTEKDTTGITTPEVTVPQTTDNGYIELPPAGDDGVRVHSWISQSYTKNTGHDIVNDKGNIYDFKEGYGTDTYKFKFLTRSHANGTISNKYTAQKGKCLYNHVSTMYGSNMGKIVRVDQIGDGSHLQNFNEYSNPGIIYILPERGHDILISFTVPEDGTYDVRAAVQRTHGLYQTNGQTSTGSRFFIEHNGAVIAQDTDNVDGGKTKPISFDERLELKKGDTVCLGHDPIDQEGNEIVALADDSIIKYFYLEKVGAEKETTGDTTKISLQMAKNELESFQISVYSPIALEGLTVKALNKPIDGLDIEFLEEHLINTNNMYFPDGLTDSDGKFNVDANLTKTMLIRFSSSKDVKEGAYTFKFVLLSPSGYVLEEFTVDLTVWNFTLPDESGCDTATSVYKQFIIEQEGIKEDQVDEYYKLYYDKLLEYRMNCYRLPYDILDERAEAYMSDPRVTCFELDATVDEATLKAYNERLKSNPVWLDKAYFYPIDEPTNMDMLKNLANLCTRLKTHAPDIRIVVPFFVNIDVGNGKDEIDFLSDYLSIWCPKAACWNPSFMGNPHNKPYFGDRMDAFKERGDKVWWYVCWEPCYPYCNLQINEIGVQHRELFWQQYLYGSDGLLYWSSNYWKDNADVWTDPATVKWITSYVYGDGSLVYPGAKVGVKGACGSLRLECIRNGIEDFDMLQLAEEYLGREWVENQIGRITPSLTEHSASDKNFARIRKAIGDAIEREINK